MKVKFACLATAMLLALSVQAQVRKCIAPDGKVTYSDSLCKSETVRETAVRPDANTIDSSGLRKDIENLKSREAVSKALESQSGQCKFAYFTLSDSLGQELAKAAKKECLDNIAAKTTGNPTTLDAYNRWKDHYSQKSTNRNAAIARADANSRGIANQNAIRGVTDAVNKKGYTCKPNFSGSALDCN